MSSNLPTIPPGADLKDPRTLLALATASNSLDGPNMKPWHLKASYESFDEAGNIADKGTFEEWRLAPDRWKRTYMSARFNQTEYGSADGVAYETGAGAAPWPESLIEPQLVHPLPEKADLDQSQPEIRSLKLSDSALNCAMLSQDFQHIVWPLGLFPAYCFDEKGMMLRASIFDGSIQTNRNQMASFFGTYVARSIVLHDHMKLLLKINLLDLRTIPDSELASITNPIAAINPSPLHISVIAGRMADLKLRGVNPQYPSESKLKGISGNVELQAVIGTDGRIHQLHVLSAPDKFLAMHSLAAVERWVYKPYLLKGEPVIVDTTISICFRLGPSRISLPGR